jgi:hypothetical protein
MSLSLQLSAGPRANRLGTLTDFGKKRFQPRNGISKYNLNRAIHTKSNPFRRWFALAGLLAASVATAFASPQDFRSPLILSPYSVSFGDIQKGKASSLQAITVLNIGVDPLHITHIAVTGDFSQTNNCPAPPAALGTNDACEIQIVFKPSSPESCSGAVTVSHDAAAGPLTVVLSGKGVLGGSEISISPPSVTFRGQKVGTGSAPQTVTVSNPGEAQAVISNIDVSGDFIVMPGSTCVRLDGPLTTNSSCTLVLAFTPVAPGKREGQVTITDNAEQSPQTVPLAGIGSQ